MLAMFVICGFYSVIICGQAGRLGLPDSTGVPGRATDSPLPDYVRDICRHENRGLPI